MLTEKEILQGLCCCRNQNEIDSCNQYDCPYFFEYKCFIALLNDVTDLLEEKDCQIAQLKNKYNP